MTLKPLSQRQAAKAAGLKTYHGCACKKCGGTERYVSSKLCILCERARSMAYYTKHRDAICDLWRTAYALNPTPAKQRAKAAYETNPAIYKIRSARWITENPEKRREIARRHAKKADAANPAKKYARQVAWRAANPEKARDGNRRWANANRAKKRAKDSARKRAKSRLNLPYVEVSRIHMIYAVAHAIGHHVDHIIPLAGCRICGAVGLHVAANLQAVDPAINQSKRNRCMACFHEHHAIQDKT